jgi:hypothetical protein
VSQLLAIFCECSFLWYFPLKCAQDHFSRVFLFIELILPLSLQSLKILFFTTSSSPPLPPPADSPVCVNYIVKFFSSSFLKSFLPLYRLVLHVLYSGTSKTVAARSLSIVLLSIQLGRLLSFPWRLLVRFVFLTLPIAIHRLQYNEIPPSLPTSVFHTRIHTKKSYPAHEGRDLISHIISCIQVRLP